MPRSEELSRAAKVAIVDFSMGNLFSVRHACALVGLDAVVTSDPKIVASSDGIILPGVGAFGDAMASLKRNELVEPLRDAVISKKPFMGICLGLQLLMSTSDEFGAHDGLDIVKGTVRKLKPVDDEGHLLKVPHIGWNSVDCPASRDWHHTPLQSLESGVFLYFVHSFAVFPEDTSIVVGTTRYGSETFCSVVHRGTLLACQFHPERSGRQGLQVYRGFADTLTVFRGGQC